VQIAPRRPISLLPRPGTTPILASQGRSHGLKPRGGTATNVVNVVFSAVGGIALLLFGLRTLSDALKRITGEQMRRLLERLTGRAWRGAIVGAVTSGILHSSAMTMLLLIGLLNAGALTLAQGIGVMLGSEIGTTVTAQIIAFNIGQYDLLFIALGFIVASVFRGKRLGDVGQIILSGGILFLGMSITTSGLRGLAEAPAVMRLLQSCGSNAILGVLVGAAVTAIVHSSTAVTALIIAMGGAGVVDLPAAIALVLGANIGTTTNALIFSIGSSLASRRLALTQAVVNVVGVGLFLPFVSPYARLLEATSGSLTRQIANAHSFFNVASTLVLVPCVGALVWVVERLVPGKETKVDLARPVLGKELLHTPSIALDRARTELLRMGEAAERMVESAEASLLKGDLSKASDVLETEESVDLFRRAIDDFLNRIDTKLLSPRDAARLHMLQHISGDMERVGDHAVNVAERAQVNIKRKFTFSPEAKEELAHMFERTRSLYSLSLQALRNEDPTLAEQALELEKEVDRLEVRYKDAHIRRLEEGTCDPAAGILFVEVLRNLERVGDHAVNIASDVLLL